MADSINRTELSAFRDHVELHGPEILETALVGAPSTKHFTVFRGITGTKIIEFADMVNIVKRWSNDFAAIADTITRRPVTLRNHFHKAELSFSPKQDFETYKGFLVNTKQDAATYYFARWAMDRASRQVANQNEFDQLFKGVANAAGSDAVDIYNGLLAEITADQTSGTPVLTPITTGAFAPATIIAQIEQIEDSFDERTRRMGMRILVSPENFRMYRRAYRAASGFHPDNPDTDTRDEIMIDGSTTILCSCPGMTGSNRAIATFRENLYIAIDSESDKEVWEFEKRHRDIDAWLDYWYGSGILVLDPRMVYINDQA